jgi:hypothetical protein
VTDTIFTLTRNNSFYKAGVTNIISKMIIIRELKHVNLDDMSGILGSIGIEELNIFSIDNNSNLKDVNIIQTDKGSKVKYMEMKSEQFVKLLNSEAKFLKYNNNSLYILRGGNFLDIKNLFATINNCDANIGRGGSQKAHGLSPLDFRLSCYLMAMFNFDYKLISYLNTFNEMTKDRYLSYKDRQRSNMFVSINMNNNLDKEFKPMIINKMPTYCENKNLGEYSLECTECI